MNAIYIIKFEYDSHLVHGNKTFRHNLISYKILYLCLVSFSKEEARMYPLSFSISKQKKSNNHINSEVMYKKCRFFFAIIKYYLDHLLFIQLLQYISSSCIFKGREIKKMRDIRSSLLLFMHDKLLKLAMLRCLSLYGAYLGAWYSSYQIFFDS